MKRKNYTGLVCLAAVVALGGGAQAFSQTDSPQGPRGGHGPQRGPKGPATLVRTPVKALTSALKLTADQAAAIQKIQSDLMTADRANRPAPPDPNGGGTPPDRATMDANRAKSQQLEKAASDQILALLSDSQKTAAASLLKLLPALREAGIPLEVLGDLNLSDNQKTQIAATVKADRDAANGEMSRDLHDKIHTDVLALLSADQQATLTAYLKAHPQGPGGGRGGFGGGRGPGGPDGGPGRQGGPDGAQDEHGGPGDMPPPPDGADAPPPGPPPTDGGN